MQDQPNNKQKRLVCPKGMKLHKSVKGRAAMMRATGASKEFARTYMKQMGTAMHEAALRIRSAAKESRSNNNDE